MIYTHETAHFRPSSRHARGAAASARKAPQRQLKPRSPGWLWAALTFTVVLFGSATANAQDAAAEHAENLHVGLGASLNLGGFAVVGNNIVAAPFGGASINVPIDIGGVFRLEPDFAYAHVSNTETRPNDTETVAANVVRPTVGAFYWFTPASSIGAYVGGRLGPSFVFSSVTEEINNGPTIETSRSQVNFNIGPAFGAEYYFSPHFCLGAEAQINFSVIGDETLEVTPDPGVPLNTNENDGLVSSSNAMLTMRVFLL